MVSFYEDKDIMVGRSHRKRGHRLLMVHFEAGLAFPYASQEMPPVLEHTHFSLHLGCREPSFLLGVVSVSPWPESRLISQSFLVLSSLLLSFWASVPKVSIQRTPSPPLRYTRTLRSYKTGKDVALSGVLTGLNTGTSFCGFGNQSL